MKKNNKEKEELERYYKILVITFLNVFFSLLGLSFCSYFCLKISTSFCKKMNVIDDPCNIIHRMFLCESLRKYRYVLNREYDVPVNYVNKYPDRIWVFWDTGFENAPDFIKICLKSIQQHSRGRIVETVDMNNLDKYIQLPDYIMKKFKEGKIGKPGFSDIVRTILLRDYGGIWMDASTFLSDDIPQYILESDIFAPISFYSEQGFYAMRVPSRIESYFLHVSRPNHYVFQCLAEFLFEYWKEINGVDYFFWFSFIAVACEEDPKFCKYFYDMYMDPNRKLNNVFVKLHRKIAANKKFDKKEWEDIKKFPIHKLSATQFIKFVDTNASDTFARKFLNEELK